MKIIAFALLFAAGTALAAETGTLVRATDLKKEPFSDASSVASLPEKAKVEVLARQGGWTRVKTETGASGWVRMLALRMGDEVQPRQGSSGLSQLFNVARTGSSGNTVTTGVRGLDKEQIKNASPNPAELAKLDGYRMGRADAEKFAGGTPRLSEQKIEYLAAQKSGAPAGQ
jgi:hypothetical protein